MEPNIESAKHDDLVAESGITTIFIKKEQGQGIIKEEIESKDLSSGSMMSELLCSFKTETEMDGSDADDEFGLEEINLNLIKDEEPEYQNTTVDGNKVSSPPVVSPQVSSVGSSGSYQRKRLPSKQLSSRVKKRSELVDTVQHYLQDDTAESVSTVFGKSVGLELDSVSDVEQTDIAKKLISDILFLAKRNKLTCESRIQSEVPHATQLSQYYQPCSSNITDSRYNQTHVPFKNQPTNYPTPSSASPSLHCTPTCNITSSVAGNENSSILTEYFNLPRSNTE